MPSLLDELVGRVKALPAGKRARIIQEARDATKHLPWVPLPGPQTDAYLTEADDVLFGGRAGGGKSQTALGWGINSAERGIIFRRELSQADGLEADGKTIIAGAASFNGTDHEWTWPPSPAHPNGKTLKIGGMKTVGSWTAHAGRERDYMGYDEAGEFAEIQVAAMDTWLRAAPGKRTRRIFASNPPRTAEGLWLIDWFAPWLDPHYHDPAAPGELRWCIYAKGRTVWVDAPADPANPKAVKIEGEEYIPRSRTFIPATLEDNPYRNTPQYLSRLQSLPEPLRSQMLYGDFQAGMEDEANQCIPTSWVRAAQKRWTNKAPEGIPMCAMGVDCTGGAKDPMVIAPRNDGWFHELKKIPAEKIPAEAAGSTAAGYVVAARRDEALVILDMGGGYGLPSYEHLKRNNIEVVGFKGAEATPRRSRNGKLPFKNKRTAAYWLLREALDPDQPGGSPITLPPDPRLLAGLTAPTYHVNAGQVLELERAEDVKERLGFSPDEAAAVVMAWFEGPKEITHALDWADQRQARRGRMHGQAARVVLSAKRRR